jgi:glucosyl-dolichyl phosphate glucuronosyltransferase
MNSTCKPKISAIICTYQNPQMLCECLQSLAVQSLNQDDFEILVIDNNSQDSTPDIVKEFSQQYSNIRYIFEPQQGLSYARNRGIQEAAGDIVAFTDDDAIVDVHWLEELIKPYGLSEDIWGVGGKTLPQWRTERPDWIKDNMLVSLSIRDYGDTARIIEWPDRLIGVNFSFRKNIFPFTGNFDVRLGRKKDILFDQEDIDIQKKIHTLGKNLYYAPGAVVWHIITENRTNPEYFLKRTYGHMRTSCIIDYNKSYKLFVKNLLYHLRKLPGNVYHLWRNKNDKKARQEYVVHKGYLVQAFLLLNPLSKIKHI